MFEYLLRLILWAVVNLVLLTGLLMSTLINIPILILATLIGGKSLRRFMHLTK